MNGDEYHLHFTSIDGDYFQRLMDGAAKLANPLRLMLRTYSPEEEAAVLDLWQTRLGKRMHDRRALGLRHDTSARTS